MKPKCTVLGEIKKIIDRWFPLPRQRNIIRGEYIRCQPKYSFCIYVLDKEPYCKCSCSKTCGCFYAENFMHPERCMHCLAPMR